LSQRPAFSAAKLRKLRLKAGGDQTFSELTDYTRRRYPFHQRQSRCLGNLPRVTRFKNAHVDRSLCAN
jgi:hypothetical protein